MQISLHLIVYLADLGINELHINRLNLSTLLDKRGLFSYVMWRLLLRFYTVLAIRPSHVMAVCLSNRTHGQSMATNVLNRIIYLFLGNSTGFNQIFQGLEDDLRLRLRS